MLHFQKNWSDGMPLTVRYFSAYNEQFPALRHTQIDPSRNVFKENFNPNNELFTSDTAHTQGSCYLWSSNLLTTNRWLPVNCSAQVAHPFIICEKKITAKTSKRFYERSMFNCNSQFLHFDLNCIRLVRNIYRSQPYQSILPHLGNVFPRILSAWAMKLNAVGNSHVMRWVKNTKCHCFTSTDTFYIENKTWHEEPCNCTNDYPAVILMLHKKTSTDDLLSLCKDGNSILEVYRCDGRADCTGGDDEDNCVHICSAHVNCTKECNYPDCVCMLQYHQCAQGGCVHQSFICDGVVNCAYDDSDELKCHYLLERLYYKGEYYYQQFSLCNGFSNKTFPNQELCLLVRDQYGITKHCNNTEHLHYCVDFSCPNHYKCPRSYCIPMHLVCDGVKDCPQGEDEEQCSEFVCRGYMRCKGMSLCLHPNYLCNGAIDCTMYGDDEILCNNRDCPGQCECTGFIIVCDKVTIHNLNPTVNYGRKAIIITYSVVEMEGIPLSSFPMIHLLNLSNSMIIPQFDPSSFKKMTRLQILDLTNVNIKNVGKVVFMGLPSLSYLYLPHIKASTLKQHSFHLPNLITLQLQAAGVQTIVDNAFCHLKILNTMNIAYNKIKVISANTFSCLGSLSFLDLRGNPLVYIATSAFEGIAVVGISTHVKHCCLITTTSQCQLDNKQFVSDKIHHICQPILVNSLSVRVLYGSIGVMLNILNILVIAKLLLKKKTEVTKVTPYVRVMAMAESLNGIFITMVFVCDLSDRSLIGYLLHILSEVLRYLGSIPRLALMLSRLEHLLLTIQMYVATCHVFSHYDRSIKRFRFIIGTSCIVFCIADAAWLRHINAGNLVAWQPYQVTDFSVNDIISIVAILSFETLTCLIVLTLYKRIYRSVTKAEERVQAKRLKKRALIAKRLVRLTVGRVTILLFSMALIVTLTYELQISAITMQLLTLLALPASLIINIMLFYE